MSAFQGQLGLSAEVTVGTWVAPARSLEFTSESMKGNYTRLKTPGIRFGRTSISDNMYAPVPKGANGTIEFSPYTKGFGLWLSNMFGTVALGSPSGGYTAQTHTPGTLVGKSLALEIVRPYLTSALGTNAYRYAGCKIPSWELSASTDSFLMCRVDIDAISEATSATITAPAYPSTVEAFAWTKASLTVGGTAVPVGSFSMTGNNGLKTDRYKISGSSTKSEQVETTYREWGITLGAVEYENQTHYNRVASATVAGAQAAIVITMTGITDTTATLTITIPSAVATDATGIMLSEGTLAIEQGLSYEILSPAGGTAPITVVYNSLDSAV